MISRQFPEIYTLFPLHSSVRGWECSLLLTLSQPLTMTWNNSHHGRVRPFAGHQSSSLLALECHSLRLTPSSFSRFPIISEKSLTLRLTHSRMCFFSVPSVNSFFHLTFGRWCSQASFVCSYFSRSLIIAPNLHVGAMLEKPSEIPKESLGPMSDELVRKSATFSELCSLILQLFYNFPICVLVNALQHWFRSIIFLRVNWKKFSLSAGPVPTWKMKHRNDAERFPHSPNNKTQKWECEIVCSNIGATAWAL